LKPDIDELCRRLVARNGQPLRVPSDGELEALEKRIGSILPAAFKAVLKTAGGVSWPVSLLDDRTIERSREWPGMPGEYVPFADDGCGNDWCFDTRICETGEFPIAFWDHEDPDAHRSDGPPCRVGGTFAEWLDERIRETVMHERAEVRHARREQIEERLAPKLPRGGAAWTPNDAEILAAERRLPVALPAQYRWFTKRFGAVDWPVRIEDAVDLYEHQDESPCTWFGRATVRRFGFNARGAVIEEQGGTRRVVADSFFLWLEGEIIRREQEDVPRANIERPRVIRRKRRD
jgi:hypothetical protein